LFASVANIEVLPSLWRSHSTTPTSALDYESERVIRQNMTQIAGGRTVFIIGERARY
jgi:hypothetical protein